MKHVDRVQYFHTGGSKAIVQRDSSIVPRVGETVIFEDLLSTDGHNRGVVNSVEYKHVTVHDGLEMTIARVYIDEIMEDQDE